jgi:5'-phosphate synthase pdxT subunit
MISLTVGVLALQGGFSEHIDLVRKAAESISSTENISKNKIQCIEVRTKEQLDQCGALIIPGGESTTISFVAAQSGLLEPLRDFVKYVANQIYDYIYKHH